LFNVSRFASQFEIPSSLDEEPESLEIEDRWILSEFQHVLEKVESAWNDLDIYTATQTLKTFGTGVLPSHYLEMVKSRLYDGDKGAAWTIHRIVRDFMTIFSPICPFFTHHISSTLYEKSAVEYDVFPKLDTKILADGKPNATELRGMTSTIQEFNGMVWNSKKEKGISLNQPLEDVKIPAELEIFTATLTRMHSLE
jgi:valyl-tRNA synthetase